ncbi:M4 family metallopeptidase [Streptosporangium sp. NPDC051023]|uniref:M4 family metallopeptidase n=1 Tax=Streptosporangium sp. NPDC051023 TaxID=3155410 RepID=UPI003450F868
MNPKVKLGAVAMLAIAAMTTTSIVSATSATAAPANAGARTITSDPFGLTPPSSEGRKRGAALADKALAAEADNLAKGEDDVFSLEKTTSVGSMQFFTYNRTYRGVPVYGGGVVVSTDGAGLKVATVDTAQKTELTLDTKTTVSAAKAASKARTLLAKVDSVSTPKLVVHALPEAGAPRMAWEVVVSGSSKTAPSVQHVYVDALNGSILSKWDAVKMGTGQGFYNGQVNITTSSGFTMRDGTRSGLACGGQNGSPYTKSTDSWGNGQGTNLETACVDAYYAAQKEWDMLKEWFNYNGINGRGGGYPARVGLNDVNAFWNGSYTNFGHNQANNQQATPMDVVGHEYGHAIYQFAGSGGGGGGGNEDGGLNESTGDIFGALLEAYANNPNDPPDYTVGEEVNLVGQGPIRYMYQPSQHSGDPNCYSSSIPNTEVHAAAGPQNHWFYLVAEGTNPGGGKPTSPVCSGPSSLTGIGIQKAGAIYLASLQLRTSSSRTHAQARAQTLAAAKTQFPNSCVEFNAVKAAWTAVSVPAGSNEPTCTQNQNDFTITANPSAASVKVGASTTTTVNTTTIGNAQSIALTATGAPTGTTVSFSPATITSGQSSSVSIATSASTPAGRYTININGAGASISHATTFTLTVTTDNPGQDDFSVAVNPSSATVQPGGSTNATLSTTVTSGNAQSVSLTASGAPTGTTVSFGSPTINSGQSSSVSIATSSTTPAGTYTITLNGAGASVSHAATFTLTVNSDQGGTDWKEWKQYNAGDIVTYSGVRYRCLQSHTSLPGWDPPNVPALWQRL